MRDADEAQGLGAHRRGRSRRHDCRPGEEKGAAGARDAYVKEVSAGSKPSEAVGTAIAAFVGFEQH
jgi:hypothetical protein